MTTRTRPTVLLETRSGYPYRYRRYASRQGAMRSASRAGALGTRVRILALPLTTKERILGLPGKYTWLEPREPTPVGARVVATHDGAGWV